MESRLPLATNAVAIYFPGIAAEWKEGCEGAKIITNMTVDDINNRTVHPVMFRSDKQVWSWAQRTQSR